MVDRDLAFKQWKVTNDVAIHDLFKRLRNKVNYLIRKAKETYYGEQLDSCSSSTELWKKLRSMNISKAAQASTNSFTADEINDTFSKNFSSRNNTSQYCTGSQWGSFHFNEISNVDVINSLYEINSNAIGLDNIPLKFIKMISPLIIQQIVHLFNAIIRSSQYPSAWKKAKNIPITRYSIYAPSVYFAHFRRSLKKLFKSSFVAISTKITCFPVISLVTGPSIVRKQRCLKFQMILGSL